MLPEPCVPAIDQPERAAVDPDLVPTLPTLPAAVTPSLPDSPADPAPLAPSLPEPAAVATPPEPSVEPGEPVVAEPVVADVAEPVVPVAPVVESVPVIDIAPAQPAESTGSAPEPELAEPAAEAEAAPAPDAAADGVESERTSLFDPITDPAAALPGQDPSTPFEMPSLPSIAATASTAASNQPWEPEQAAWTPEPVTPTVRARRQRRSPVRSLFGMVFAAALAAGAGAGAHLGYDWYTEREEPPVAATAPDRPSDLAAWNQVDPPAVRYTDTATTIVTSGGMREVTTHRDLVSGSRLVTVSETNADGDTSTFDVELRDAAAFLRTAPDAPWAPVPVEEATAIIGDEGLTDVYTVSDLFPIEALPFVSILESEELKLPLGAIRQQPIPTVGDGVAAPDDTDPVIDDDAAADDAAAAEQPLDAGDVRRPTQVWHFRVLLDVDAFRAAEGAAFEAWERQLGRAAGSHFEVWIDRNGIVRRLTIDAEGVKLTQTLISAAPTSETFAAPIPADVPADPALGSEPAEPTEPTG